MGPNLSHATPKPLTSTANLVKPDLTSYCKHNLVEKWHVSFCVTGNTANQGIHKAVYEVLHLNNPSILSLTAPSGKRRQTLCHTCPICFQLCLRLARFSLIRSSVQPLSRDPEQYVLHGFTEFEHENYNPLLKQKLFIAMHKLK